MYSFLKAEFFLFIVVLCGMAFIPIQAEGQKKLSAQETYNSQVAAFRARQYDNRYDNRYNNNNRWNWGAYDYDPYFYDGGTRYYNNDAYYNDGRYDGNVRVRTYRRY